MARTKKAFNGKRRELLLRIWDIFLENGYEDTTLSRIIRELDISKGVFYHYFQSKEACADLSIEMMVGRMIDRLREEDLSGLTADDKLRRLILSGTQFFHQDTHWDRAINAPSNAVFHQKLMIATVKLLAPVYAEVISKGVAEGVFDTVHPLEAAEMVLTLSNFYLDADLFHWDLESVPEKVRALADAAERILGAPKGILDFMCSMG